MITQKKRKLSPAWIDFSQTERKMLFNLSETLFVQLGLYTLTGGALESGVFFIKRRQRRGNFYLDTFEY